MKESAPQMIQYISDEIVYKYTLFKSRLSQSDRGDESMNDQS